MKTQLIAALLISGAVIASPAFAGNNASNAPFTTFPGVSTQSRADVKAQLVAAIARQAPAARNTALAQGNGQTTFAHP